MPRKLYPRFGFTLLMLVALVPITTYADTVLRRTTLLVHDLESSIRFYSSLGLNPFYDAEQSLSKDGSILGGKDLPLAGEPTDSRIVILIGPDKETGMLGLLAYGSPPLGKSRAGLNGLGEGDVVLMFYVDDMDAVYQALSADGARFHRKPYRYEVRDNQGDIRSSGSRMFVWDPDDRLVEIAQRD